jgi:MoxR-like ATPase
MKNLITGKTVEVHPKGMKTFNIPNRLFITATSNYEDAISLPADDERRWGIYYLRPPAFPIRVTQEGLLQSDTRSHHLTHRPG